MRIALVQSRLGTDLTANLELAVSRMKEAAAAGAQVICFPEIQLSPFFPQFAGQDASQWAIKLEHDAITSLRLTCRELGVAAFPNVYLLENEGAYDATVAIGSDGEILGVSKMVHVVQIPPFHEQDYYAPSDTGFHVYDTRFGRVGVVVCYDRHYPESFRACALKGAELVVIPTANTKDEDLELFAWEIRVPAVQNGLYVAMCNRVGREHDMDFCGESIVVGPAGEIIARADDTEQILFADIDPSRIEKERAVRPYLDLRRPALFEI